MPGQVVVAAAWADQAAGRVGGHPAIVLAVVPLAVLRAEDPLPALDIHGYRRLGQNLRIPLMATEVTPGGLQELTHWIVSEATDYVRGDVVIKGGITGLMKIAHLGEAFNLPCEIHDGYNAMNNVATAKMSRHTRRQASGSAGRLVW